MQVEIPGIEDTARSRTGVRYEPGVPRGERVRPKPCADPSKGKFSKHRCGDAKGS